MLTQGFYPPRMDYSGYFIPSGYYPITPPYNHPYDYQLISGPSQDIHLESTANYLSASSNVAYQSYPQFPTPPLSTSPHATTTIATPVAVQRIREDKRTTSVIMKIEDQKVFEIKTNNSVNNFTSGIASSSSASSVSESEDDTICKWENCYSIFERLDTLASHVTQKHAVASAGGLYFCKWEGCPRSERGFNARYKMLVHVRTHTKEKPHHCPQCNKCFSRAENLKIHTRSHSGEKPYICPVEGCTKAYSNSSDRFKHTRTHSTEKPYTCKIPGCSKRYTDPSSLRKHVKTFKHTTYANGGGSPNTEAHHYMKKHDFEQHKEQPQPKIIPDRPVAICSCSRNCFDHVCRTEGYRFGGHFLNNTFNPTILMYDQQLAGTRDRGPTDYSTDFKFERMDVDAPLDLSVSNKSRQLF